MSPPSQTDFPATDNIRLLGTLLGETIREHRGEQLYQCIEDVRRMSIDARRGGKQEMAMLQTRLVELPSEETYHLARGFALFLNLANIAEQYAELNEIQPDNALSDCVVGKLEELIKQDVGANKLYDTVCNLSIELVLTAHPTEVMRRTISNKYLRIAQLLEEKALCGVRENELEKITNELRRVVTEIWKTDEIRRHQPTPVDEARSALIVVEQTLWDALPLATRQLSSTLEQHTGQALPLDVVPIRFCSWIGGDRDGNPNVTADVTRHVICVSRWKSAELFAKEITALRSELSMNQCNARLAEKTKGEREHEPYRVLLKRLIKKLNRTMRRMEADLEGVPSKKTKIINSSQDLLEPLLLCYESLLECGDKIIADGRLTDIIRRAYAFGAILMPLDIRQESDRHTEALDEITQYLSLGSYARWSETERRQFLLSELGNKRPLIPDNFPASENVQIVLDTFRMIADQAPETFGAYVISMAAEASDVLAVELLQKACGVQSPLRVAPLFERLDDLQGASQTMEALWSSPAYLERINGKQEIMIGYSDSAKDAGQLAAAWGLYGAQEKLVALAKKHDIKLTLFHGRGGSVARGGGPASSAIRSQPPGSVNGSMRVTEQGEVIQAKYGLPGLAVQNLHIYLSAVLDATLNPPPEPKQSWRDEMEQLADDALEGFRSVIQQNPNFVPYFIQATPEAELATLKIGSRPARRRRGEGITYLRAIPWIFAWTQTRLMLPAWLGVGTAYKNALARDAKAALLEMEANWPFFASTLDSIEMVLAKADPEVATLYDTRLVDDELKPLGEELRTRYQEIVAAVKEITNHKRLLENEPEIRHGLDVRNPYVDPLNILQVELLARSRGGETGIIADALVIVINGISAGMRNTG